MSKDNYREYLRSNYKLAKAELQKQGKPHTKKDVYGFLRSKFYNAQDEKTSGISDPNPKQLTTEPTPAAAAATTNKRRPLNMKALQELHLKLIKL